MIWIIVFTIILPTVIIVISVKPGGIPPEAQLAVKKFKGLNCAHRGLYTDDQRIPENSLTAFVAARDKGYGVELDVHMTADEQIVVFHDYDLSRVCGLDKPIGETTYEEMKKLRLFNTDEKIPTLVEALEILGDTPIIVEIKPAKGKNPILCKKTLEILERHGQNWCVESFDPRVCRWFKKNAPTVLRGQLGCPSHDYVGISKMSSIVLGNLLFNILSRPHFIAYKNKPYPFIVKICMIMKPMKAAWTITPEHDISKVENENDIVIFEHYTPAPRFRD